MAVGNLVANLTANTSGWSKGLYTAAAGIGKFAGNAVAELGKTSRAWLDYKTKVISASNDASRVVIQQSRLAIQQKRIELQQMRAMASQQSSGGGVKIGMLGHIGLAAGGIGAIAGIFKSLGGGASGLVQLAAEAEQTAISFEVMLGSADKANAMVAEMRAFAAKTPLETKDIQDAGRTLMQFGVDGNNVMPMLKMLGDVSGGNADRFSRLSLAFAQVSAAGRLQGQDLLQMVNSGFNPLKVISEQTGESMADLKAKMEAGGISTQMVVGAFQAATAAGGQFHGMMDRQSKTTAGLFSTLRDNVMLAGVDIGKAMIDGFNLNGLMADATSFLEMFRSQWLPGIITTINTMGQAFGRVIQFFKDGWAEWLANSISSLIDFIANFDLYWQIAQQTIVMWASNGILRVQDFFTNIGELLTWLSGNWSDVFFTMGDYVLTIFINLGQNLRDIWSGVLEFIKGNGFQFDPTPLTEGFKSTISKMPEFTKQALAETTPELDALYKELAKRQAEATAKSMAQPNVTSPFSDEMTPFESSAKSGGNKKGKSLSAAAEFGSKDALTIIANASSRGKDPVEKNTNTIAKESVKQTGFLQKLVDHVADINNVGVVELPA